MEQYRKTIRQIRLDKGFTQKETYHELVSKSYAIEYEKDNHDMTVTNFTLLLDRLYLSFDEFFFIHHQYLPTPTKNWIKKGNQAVETGNQRALQTVIQFFETEKNDYHDFLAAVYRLMAYEMTNNWGNDTYPQADVTIVTTFLLKKESWSCQELSLFSDIQRFFPLDTRTILVKSALKNVKKYQAFEKYPRIVNVLIINYLIELLWHEWTEIPFIEKLLQLLEKTTQPLFYSGERIYYEYLKGIHQIVRGETTKGAKRADQAITTLQFLCPEMDTLGLERHLKSFRKEAKS